MKMNGIKWRSFLVAIAAVLLLASTGRGAALLQPAVLVDQNWAPAQGEVVTSAFRVETLSCNFCLDTIAGKLQTLQGTFGLQADLDNQLLFVDHLPKVSSGAVAEKIGSAGYPARLLGRGKRVRQAAPGGNGQEPKAVVNSGCNSRRCGATANEWKELFQRYFAK